MKSTQLTFVTFASLALAQGDRWGLHGKALTQQEVSTMFKYWNIDCQDRKGKIACFSSPVKQGSTRKDNFTSLCQEKGSCENCKLLDIGDNVMNIRCDVAAQNNASARPQETAKPEKTELQSPPQEEDAF